MSKQTERPVLPVLVVEDDPIRRERLCTDLESSGYPVFGDSSESDFLRRVSEWKIAGIVAGTIRVDLGAWLHENRPDLEERTVLVKEVFRTKRLLSSVRKSIGRPVNTARILVVDDDEPIREIMSVLLALSGYRARTVPGGGQALKLLDSGERFDLVTSDLMNAPMDGISLLDELKRRYPDIPVLIVTAVHDISVALAAIRSGAYDYLLKPFEREQLSITIRRALEHRDLKLENRKLRARLEKLKQRRQPTRKL